MSDRSRQATGRAYVRAGDAASDWRWRRGAGASPELGCFTTPNVFSNVRGMATIRGYAWLLFALGAFLVQASSDTQTLPAWHEEISVYPARGAPVLEDPDEDLVVSFGLGCSEAGPIRIETSGVRPNVSLCAGGRQYPLLIMSYASGVPYWVADFLLPLHKGQIFRLRWLGLLFGVLNLLVAWKLMRRIVDVRTADVVVVAMSLTSPFSFMQAILVHYEVVPWLMCITAVYLLSFEEGLAPGATGPAAPATRRLVAVSALLGMALLANLKAVLIVAPLAFIAIRAGVRFGTIRGRQWLLMIAVVVLVLSPLIAGNAIDGGLQFGQELEVRSWTFLENLRPLTLAAEVPGLIWFWADSRNWMAAALGGEPEPPILGVLATVPPLVYCVGTLVGFLWRGRGRIVPAACGALIVAFMLLSAFLYNNYPKGNYSPLYAALGIAAGVTAVDLSRLVARAVRQRAGWLETAVVLTLFAGLAWQAVAGASPTTIPVSFNSLAERDLGEYLDRNADPDVPILVTTYVLTDVIEAVTVRPVRTVKAYQFLDCPPGINRAFALDDAMRREGMECVHRRVDRLLRNFPTTTRFLVPVNFEVVDHPFAHEFGPVIESAARSAHREVRVEASFSGKDTGPVLRLIRVGPVTDESP